MEAFNVEGQAGFLTPQQAAKVAGVEAGTFSQWIARGKVRVERFPVGTQSRRARVPREEAERIKELVEQNLPLPVVVAEPVGAAQ